MTDDLPQPDRAPSAPSPERLFAEHYLPVLRLCLRHLRDHTDAEDAAQEVFRRAVQQQSELRGDALPWLITVAKHVCLDELRRRRSGRAALERSASDAHADDLPADAVDSPERVVVGHYFVRELLGRLTPAERRVVAGRVYDDESGVETAQALGLSSSTTRVLLSRARVKLRKYLEEGQAAFAGVPLLLTRTLHDLRRRVLLRPGFAEGGTAVFMPAALVLTVMLTPAAGVAGSFGTASATGTRHLQGAAAAVASATAPNAAPGATLRRGLDGGGPSAADHGGPRPVTPNRATIPLTQPNVDEVTPYDVEPSPNYGTDHTVLMVGTLDGVPGYQLFRSTDGGATWTFVSGSGTKSSDTSSVSTGPQSGQLVLPPTTFAAGRFYVEGNGGLQMTTDGGRTFTTIAPPASGYVSAAPAWSDLGVILSNVALWQLANGVTPVPLSAFSAQDQAIGAPVLVHGGPNGYELLQPVDSLTLGAAPPAQVLHCSPACDTATILPFDGGPVELVESPYEATDHTLFALQHGMTLAVSHDDGRTFASLGPRPIDALAAVPGPYGRRLVATMGSDANNLALAYSDDDGVSWHAALVDAGLGLSAPQTVTYLGSGRLIATMRSDPHNRRYAFACSSDASRWTTCTAQGS